MSDALLFVLAGAFLIVVLVALTILQEHRNARRFEGVACPKCGNTFGSGAFAIWHMHNRLAWYCRWESGPLMTCKHCKAKCRFTWTSQLHAQQFENGGDAEVGIGPGGV